MSSTLNLVLCGLGGQGILFMTRVLAQTALSQGQTVLGAETHGMAQRGGSVVSHLRIGDASSSLVRAGTAHFLLALEENEAYRNLPFLAPHGRLFANAPPGTFPRPGVREYLEAHAVHCRAVEAGRLALLMGAPLSANLALLGFTAGSGKGPYTAAELRRTVEEISPERFREVNLRVFDAGRDAAAGEDAP